MFPRGTHFTFESTEAIRIKCLAEGHNILMWIKCLAEGHNILMWIKCLAEGHNILMWIKCLAEGHNILMQPVSKRRSLYPETDMLTT